MIASIRRGSKRRSIDSKDGCADPRPVVVLSCLLRPRGAYPVGLVQDAEHRGGQSTVVASGKHLAQAPFVMG